MARKAGNKLQVPRLNGDSSIMHTWLTTAQAAEYCGVALSTFRSRIMHKVKCRRYGWRLYFEPESLKLYVETGDDPANHPRAATTFRSENKTGG